MEELKEKIISLTLELDRVKKTSKQRFEKNKKLESEMTYLKLQHGRLENIKSFLEDKGFKSKTERGIYSVSFTVFNAIRSLMNKACPMKTPEVDGLYAVKVDGVWTTEYVFHNLCWCFRDDETGKPVGIHFFNVEEFILLQAD